NAVITRTILCLGKCYDWTIMKCVRCLLQLQNLRQRGQTVTWTGLSSVVTRVHPCQSRPQKSLIQDDLFERVAKKNKTKATFNRVVDVFIKQDVRRRGHVDFIYAALQKMPEFGVERDITVYNKLLDVFPKEVFVPRNFIQRMYNHYPRQQECGVQVLEQMETYGVMPNVETKVLLMQIFGTKGHPVRKYQRLLYWFPKFKHDPVDLAKFSLKRIADDLDAKITVYQVKMRHRPSLRHVHGQPGRPGHSEPVDIEPPGDQPHVGSSPDTFSTGLWLSRTAGFSRFSTRSGSGTAGV
uniref:ECSIT signaling integrator n=1 Tax=Neogobius melanostomus TaxID=47308 RepID=A0A8C6WQR0_9GOBI